MRPVLEPEARPDTAEARRAGDGALGASAVLVLSSLAVASAFMVRPGPTPTSLAAPSPLPVLATGRGSEAAWDGAEPLGGHVLVATGAENERVATLRDGDGWTDYTLRTRLRWLAGRRLSLLVRVDGEASFVRCVLDGGTIRIEEVSDGIPRTLATARVPDYRGRAFDAVVTAEGRDVAVALDGVTAVTATVRRRSGTAGLAVWDAEWGHAGLLAEYVRVERAGAVTRARVLPAEAPALEDVDRGE